MESTPRISFVEHVVAAEKRRKEKQPRRLRSSVCVDYRPDSLAQIFENGGCASGFDVLILILGEKNSKSDHSLWSELETIRMVSGYVDRGAVLIKVDFYCNRYPLPPRARILGVRVAAIDQGRITFAEGSEVIGQLALGDMEKLGHDPPIGGLPGCGKKKKGTSLFSSSGIFDCRCDLFQFCDTALHCFWPGIGRCKRKGSD